MVTSLVSLTEPGLMKPLGGSLTCVSLPEHTGQSIPPWLHYSQVVL